MHGVDHHQPTAPLRRALHSLRDLRAFSADPYTSMQRLYGENGPVSPIGAGPVRLSLMLGAQATEFILANNQLFSWERAFAGLIPLVGPAALTVNDGERHRHLRRLVTPAFSARRVTAHIGTVTRHVDRAIETWRSGDVVEVYGPLRRAVRHATVDSLFGMGAADRADGLDGWLQTIHRAIDTSLLVSRIQRWGLPSWRRALAARASVQRWVADEIAQRSRESTPQDDVLAALLEGAEDGTRLLDDEISDQLVNLLEAGAETISAQLSWVLYCALRNPAVWSTIAAEVADRLPAEGLPTAEQLAELTYLNRVISETMRLYPATSIAPRVAATDFTFAGHSFDAGSRLIFSPFHTHRLPSIWPDPERFDPRRWDPASEGYRHPAPHEFLPFGGGPHRCIGANFATMVVRAAVVALVHRVDPWLVSRDVQPTGLIGMRPRDGLMLLITATRPSE